MSFYIFNNKKIYYREVGEGTPLLLLHGNTASSNMFLDVADKYAEKFKVILIDFLGHGQSDRLEEFPADLWFYEAEQVIAFLKEKNYKKVNIIGCSGGALVALNVALESPELINKVIADSFEGEQPLKAFTENVVKERENSKFDENSRAFYASMHGDDWECVVDNDTQAIYKNDKEIGKFFHKDFAQLSVDVLMTGSREDEFISLIDPNFFVKTFRDLAAKTKHAKMYLFKSGGHPAMLSNDEEFYNLSLHFFRD